MYLETGQYDLLRAEYERKGALLFMQGGTSGNMLIDALIANVKKRAEDVGVAFTSEVRVPADLKIQDVHMNRLLGNILENALEAVNELNRFSGLDDSNEMKKFCGLDHIEHKGKWIRLTIRYDRGNLYIRCENSCYHVLNPNFETTKVWKKEHGMGLGIIREIASLYDGDVEIDYKENIFCIQVLLLHVDRLA